MIGRISNLYSSEQNLQKPQGFISHLCRAVAHRRPFTLTVPSHTIRDFVHADDVAARILTWAQGCDHAPETIIKVLAAGRSVTLGRVIGMVHAIGSRSPQVAFAVRPSSSMQPTLLRFRSVVRSDLEAAVPGRTLEEGIASVWTEALRSRHRAAW
jgi:UDP-glucose 4-epimerase